MKKIEKLTVAFHDRIVGTLSLVPDGKLCAFEYSQEWLADGFSISPLELPLKAGLFLAKPTPFYGNFGIFEDSLPDGYGRYLLHKTLLRQGIDDTSLSALDRLSIVGENGMGALTYQPQLFAPSPLSSQVSPLSSLLSPLKDFDLLQEKALEVLRERQDTDAELLLYNSGNSGGCRPKAVFKDEEGHWLVKFRHTYDPQNMGQEEYRYNEQARKCGIDVPDFKLVGGKYFASRRFDLLSNGERVHTATAGGLLSVSLSNPVLDYTNLLALTGYLTQDADAVKEMYRRMVFNYLMDNKDDHCKNFSFFVKQKSDGHWHWLLAPAYDLTHCTEGYNGEHATSVNNTGHPAVGDFIAVGTKNKLKAAWCKDAYEEMRERIETFDH